MFFACRVPSAPHLCVPSPLSPCPQVLAGHLVWVFLGVSILHVMARPFFGKASRWMKASLNTYWVWWAIGGERRLYYRI